MNVYLRVNEDSNYIVLNRESCTCFENY